VKGLRLFRNKATEFGGKILRMSLLQSDIVRPSVQREVPETAEPVRVLGPYKFTVEEYDALAELNVPQGKTELVYGEIIQIPPAGNGHSVALEHLRNLLRVHFSRPWFIRTQSTHRMDKHNAREPDIALLKSEPIDRAKLDELPILIVEIADSTLSYDLGRKRLFYANCDVPEYWVVDFRRKVVHVFRGPVVNATEAVQAYATEQIVGMDGELTMLAAPGAVIRVADFMPKSAIE